MKLPRRNFLRLAAGAAAFPTVQRIARADAYPSRPVRFIVGFPPGGPNDIYGRLIAQWLSEKLDQPVVVENRPGGGTNLATEQVVRAAPDGYTLLMANISNAINTTLYKNLPFDFVRDVSAVAGVARLPFVMELNLAVPAWTVSEFISYAKSNPGKVNFASAGNGTGVHMAGELFKFMTDVDMLHVPYRGSAPALTDLFAGRVQVMFDALPSSIGYIKAGKLRALAVTTAIRSDALPDVPAVGDTVPGYEVSGWLGVGAPSHTPEEVIGKLNKEINAALADPVVKARIADLGGTVLRGSPADFHNLIAAETEKWGKVVKFANLKAG